MQGFIPQVQIPTPSGLFRADFADPANETVIEFDGKEKYTDYKPTDEVLLAERRRRTRWSKWAGWSSGLSGST